MKVTRKAIRRSVKVPAALAARVDQIARSRRTSASKVLEQLIELGMASMESERKRFFDVADRLAASKDRKEQKRLKEELAKMTFGE